MGLRCPRCGGKIELALGATFARCGYCQAAIVRAGDDVLLGRYLVTKRLTPDAARRALDRWMVGNEPSRWLSLGAKIDPPTLVWLPVWYARTQDPADAGHVRVHEARAERAGLPEIHARLIPSAGLRRLEQQGPADAGDEALPPPTVPWATFAATLKSERPIEQALVHVPFYRFTYTYLGKHLAVVVDAATGEVRPGAYPKRPRWPFLALSIGALTTFALADFALAFARADHPHVVPVIYPFGWLVCLVVARVLTAVC